MIPRLKPFTGKEELKALFSYLPHAVKKFEEDFAHTFNTKFALAFPYGRSALWAFFKAMDIKGAEVVQPAYTCSVVGHATVLSGNTPCFVDCTLYDYNMDLDLLEGAINEHTRAVIPTHLFGYPMDIHQITEIVKEAEKRYSQRIYIIQDCAHSFEAEWKGESVINAGDGALFSLNISKQVTSIFGGMFTTNDEEIGKKLQAWRDEHFLEKKWMEKLSRFLYLPAAMIAFTPTIYGFTYWLQDRTSILKGLTDAYHLDDKIHFPPDFDHLLCNTEARVGIVQLKKYQNIKHLRREIADFYFENLKPPSSWVLPPRVQGATFSHFPIRVPNRDDILQLAAKKGVQLGCLIEYSMPYLKAYKKFTKNAEYNNSLLCSKSMINLPIYPGIDSRSLNKVLQMINSGYLWKK